MKLKTKINKFKWFIIFIIILILGGFLLNFGINYYYKIAYPIKYSELVEKYAKEYNLNESFVYSVIKTESGFRKDAVSFADAYGLMQIQEPTFEWAKSKINEKDDVTKDDLFNEEINIKYGCFIYSLLIDEFKTQDNAIAAYHAGWGNVKSWLKNEKYVDDNKNLITTPIQKTNNYIDKINNTQKIYITLYDIK